MTIKHCCPTKITGISREAILAMLLVQFTLGPAVLLVDVIAAPLLSFFVAKKKVTNLPAGRQGKTPLLAIAPRLKGALRRILLKLVTLMSAIAATFISFLTKID